MAVFAVKKNVHKGDVFAALDIGSSKVTCAIARANDKDVSQLKLLGLGQQVAKGLKSGIITDMDALEDSILNAVHSAEQNAERTIGSLYVSLPGSVIQSHIFQVELALGGEPVGPEHIRQLLTLGKHAQEFKSSQIIHALPLEYAIDEHQGIKDPKGMFGSKLQAQIHVLSAPMGLLKNIAACVGRCHLDVNGFVVSSYASALATLVDDELELGVTVIDIGGGSTTIASFVNGALVYLGSVPIGGMHITNDIARGLSTPVSQAERLKTLYGSVFPLTLDDKEQLIVPQLGEEHTVPQQVPKSFFVSIIRARIEEIFEHVQKKINASGVGDLISQRIVLTGGTSQLPGVIEFLSAQWNKPVRMGQPIGLLGEEITKNPSFATIAGLLHYAFRDERSREMTLPPQSGHLWQRFLAWFKSDI